MVWGTVRAGSGRSAETVPCLGFEGAGREERFEPGRFLDNSASIFLRMA